MFRRIFRNSLIPRLCRLRTPKSALNFSTSTRMKSKDDAPILFDNLKAIYQKQSLKQTSQIDEISSFEEIPNFPMNLLPVFHGQNIFKPTPIQVSLIYHFFNSSKSDLMIKSQTGTGKSLGYVMLLMAAILQKKLNSGLLTNSFSTKPSSSKFSMNHLILVPSTMLANQIYRWITVFQKALPDCKNDAVKLLVSDTDSLVSECNAELNAGPASILIATPEKFRLTMAQGKIDISGLKTVIVDEADALIKPLKTHAPQSVKKNREKHPVTTLVLLRELFDIIGADKLQRKPRLIVASATLNKATRDDLLKSKLVDSAIFLEAKASSFPEDQSLDGTKLLVCPKNISHKHAVLNNPDDVDEVVQLIRNICMNHLPTDGSRGLILLPSSQSKVGFISLLNSHANLGCTISLLSDFAPNSPARLFVGSDVDCRGLDVKQLSFVIILDLPESLAHYVHMAGRVGRMTESGTVYTILGTSQDFVKFTGLMSQLGVSSSPALLQ